MCVLISYYVQLVQYGRLSPGDDLCPANIRYPGVITQARQGEAQDTEVRSHSSSPVVTVTCYTLLLRRSV